MSQIEPINKENITVSDEDNKLDEEIEITKEQIENADNPEDITSKSTFNPSDMEKFTKQMEKMPMDKRLKLLEFLGQNYQNFDNNNTFDKKLNTVDENKHDIMKKNLKEKMEQLKMRRKSRTALKYIMEEKQKMQNKKQAKKDVISDPLTNQDN